MAHVVCHPDGIRCYSKSSGWHEVNLVSHRDDLHDVISLLDKLQQIYYITWMKYGAALSHPDDMTKFEKLIQMTLCDIWMSYNKFSTSSEWHTPQRLSHADAKTDFKFSRPAMALQCLRMYTVKLALQNGRYSQHRRWNTNQTWGEYELQTQTSNAAVDVMPVN